MRLRRVVPIAQIAGVEIRLDWSLLVTFALIVISLAGGVFPAWHPDWAPGLRWGTAVAAAVLFLVSVLLHELAHALVGRARGMDIRRVTLFLFGGMAHLEQEPPNWRAELLMAGVGPVVSLMIGFLCLFAAGELGGLAGVNDPAEMETLLAQLGALPTLLVWLGSINVILALFNLVPGFPLDGGRVLRAAIWGITGNLATATAYAAMLGRMFGWLLIACGLAMVLGLTVPVFGRGAVGGIWLMLIGWFLYSAALMSHRQMLACRALRALAVKDVMSREYIPVAPDMTLATFVDDILLHNRGPAFPVIHGDELVGLIGLSDVRKVPRERWAAQRVGDVMEPTAHLATVEPDDQARRALEILRRGQTDQLPVVKGRALRGFVRRNDILKWIAVRGERWAASSDRAMLRR